MPSTLKPLDPTQVELEISITPEEYSAAQDAAFRKLVRNAKIPGFRPGKVPRKIFEGQYGTAGILERALDDLLSAKYPAALEEHGIEPLTQPSVELLPAEEGQPPRFKAVVSVRPDFEPKDYSGVEITDVPETAGDADVERALEQLRKDAVFTITVHDVKEPELPELDDELAKRISRSENLDDLKAEIRRRLDDTVKRNARRHMSGQLLDKIVAANDFPLPEVLIERELGTLLDESRQYVTRAGISWDEYLQQSGKTEAELREGFRPEAERRVKTTLLVEAIAKKEGIHATQADVETELTALAAQYGQPRERIVQALQSNVAALIDGIVRTKTIDRLIDQAKRTPAPPAAPATDPGTAAVTEGA